MITPMTKLTMLIYHRDYNKFLTDLRDHGVVHVHAKKQTLQDENMKAKMAEVKHINNVVKLLEKSISQQVNKSTSEVASRRLSDLKNEALIDHIDQQYAKIDSIQQEIASLQKDSNVYAQWGKFPEERLNQIKANNWDVRFFTVPSRKYDNAWEEEFNAFCGALPRYQRPRKVIFAAVPRNPTGKIEKPKLRKIYGADQLVAKQNEIG